MRDVEDMGAAPGAPELREGQALSGLLLPARGKIWVNAAEARQYPPRRRFTIGHDGRQALFCRRATIHETVTLPARDIEEEASAFAATRCATSGTSLAATERRIASLL